MTSPKLEASGRGGDSLTASPSLGSDAAARAEACGRAAKTTRCRRFAGSWLSTSWGPRAKAPLRHGQPNIPNDAFPMPSAKGCSQARTKAVSFCKISCSFPLPLFRLMGCYCCYSYYCFCSCCGFCYPARLPTYLRAHRTSMIALQAAFLKRRTMTASRTA